MDKFTEILNSIDWIFAGVILIGGRYWGSNFFRLSKNSALNFLGFATAFGLVYLAIIHFTKGIQKQQFANLFITYLVMTSFYQLLGKLIFEKVESLFGKKKITTVPEAIEKYEDATGEKVVGKPQVKPN